MNDGLKYMQVAHESNDNGLGVSGSIYLDDVADTSLQIELTSTHNKPCS